MDDQKRGDDAADYAPRPPRNNPKKSSEQNKQDAPNYDERTHGGPALEKDDLSSANDK